MLPSLKQWFDSVRDLQLQNDYDGTVPSEQVKVEAEKRGLEVYIPNDYVLVLDIDSEEEFKKTVSKIHSFKSRLSVYEAWYTESSTKGHFHIYLTILKPLPLVERILAQACLGSDSCHCLYSYFRVLNKEKFPLMFFETPGAEKKTISL